LTKINDFWIKNQASANKIVLRSLVNSCRHKTQISECFSSSLLSKLKCWWSLEKELD